MYLSNRTELVIFLLIGLVVFGLAISWVHRTRVRDGWGRVQVQNNFKQLSLACYSCNDTFKRLPPAFDKFGQMEFPASVHVHLLPFIEQDLLYKKYLAQEGKGEEAASFIIPTFIQREDESQNRGAGIQNLAANLRVFAEKGVDTKFDANMPALAGIEPGNSAIPRTFADGTSNTILFAAKYGQCQEGGSRYAAAPNSAFAAFFGQNAARKKAHPMDPTATFQAQPAADQCLTTPLMAQSMAQAGLQVGLADGSGRMINLDMSPRTWNLLVQPNDGLEPGDDW